MPVLDPEAAALLQRFRDLDLPPFHTLTPSGARELRTKTRHLAAGPPVEFDGSIEDDVIVGPSGPLPVRFYSPNASGIPASLVYFHGGGWVVGDLDTHDALARGIAAASGVRVMAVQYRLAPEDPFPAALEDAWAATAWMAERSAARMAVGGDSAGGNLATVVAARARNTAVAVAAQLLIYPVTDLSSTDTASYREFGEGYWLTTKAMRWFRGHYLPADVPRRDPDVSPLHRADLYGMPPAVIVTAGCDVLRDEGAMYAERLREVGTPVEYRCYEGMLHGFMSMPGALTKAGVALAETGRALRKWMVRHRMDSV